MCSETEILAPLFSHTQTMFTHSVNTHGEQQDGGDSDGDNCSLVHLGLEHTSKYFDSLHSRTGFTVTRVISW